MTGEPLRLRRVRVTRMATVSLLLSLGAAGLSGCYIVTPYAVPVSSPPPPPYMPPSAHPSGPPRPGGPTTAPPASGASPSPAPAARGVPPGSAQNCQAVTVEAHAETVVRQNGQRENVWVPTQVQQVCQ